MHMCTGFCGCVRICYALGQTLCFVLVQAVSDSGYIFCLCAIYARLLLLLFVLHSAHHSLELLCML